MLATLSPRLESQIHGCWLGKSIGGTLGLPAEGKMDRLNFSFYDPVPTVAPPNDDLELQLVWLDLVEKSDGSLTQEDFARAWLDHIHYMWDEYGRCRWNLRRGVPLGSVGTFENPFHAGMGSPIRSEIWACLFPGDTDSAAHYAALDASLDHGLEGIAGEVLFSVMQSAVLSGAKLPDALTLALRYVPASCETARAVHFVSQAFEQGTPEWDGRAELLRRHGSDNFTHAPLNVALTVWALLYGDADFEKTVLLAVNAGYDTDCTAATAGATLGLMLGTEGIPRRWSEPIGEEVFVGPGILGINAPATLRELSDRTAQARLRKQSWKGEAWQHVPPAVNLRELPGTITVAPRDGGAGVAWANGELPDAIKAAGGGRWTWETASSHPHRLVCLAEAGARFFINDELVLECPPGLPFVPTPHRCPEGSWAVVNPGAGRHEIRVELGRGSAGQNASVILAYANSHLCPWTAEELAHPARLAAP